MPDRSVVVALRAEIAGFKAAMAEATRATKGVGDETEKSGKKATTAMGQLVQSAVKNEQAWTRTGVALLGIGTAMAAGVGIAINKFAEFDQAMSSVKASTHETAGNMDLLRAAALKAGADTQFSATEAANAIEEMAKAGISTADVLGGGLTGAMSLAAAGGLGVAEAAETAATALTIFKLQGKDIPHVADLLAAGAGKAQGSVSDMGMALKQAGLVANQTGLSIEETTGGLAAFASAGLIGSDAGTSFKAMLQRLTPQSAQAKQTMDDLGISAYDAGGNFIGLDKFAGNLRESMKDLTPEARNAAMSVIFGSDAVRASSVLYDQGEAGIRKWIDGVNDAGYAAVTAALKMDNLRGDLEFLSGSIDTALIQTGSAGNDVLREMVQNLTHVVDAYGQLPEPVQRATLQFGAMAAGGALLGGTFLTVVPKVIEMRKSVRSLAEDSPKAAKGLRAVGKAAGVLAVLSVAGTAMSSFTDETNKSVLSLAESTKFLATTSTNVEKVNAQFAELQTKNGNTAGFKSLQDALDNLANPGTVDRMQDVSASLLGILNFPYENGRPQREALIEQLESMGGGLAELVKNGQAEQAAAQFEVFAAAAKSAGMSQEDLLDLMPAYRDALADQETKAKLAETAQVDLGKAFESTSGSIAGVAVSAEDASKAIDAFNDELDRILGVTFSVQEAQDAWQKGLNDLADAAKKNGKALSGTTDEAIANRDVMRDQVRAGFDVVKAMAEQGASSDALKAKTAELKQNFLDQAAAAGFNKDEVALLAAAFDGIPSRVESIVDVATQTASAKLEAFKAEMAALNGTTATVAVRFRQQGGTVSSLLSIAQAKGSVLDFYGDGGVAESHVAQIAPAGAMRLWAEPETGGEAYIPLAPSKRDRSLRIWEETGDRLGVNYVRFAEGGFAGSGGGAARAGSGPMTARLSRADIWELADAVSRVTLSLNGDRVSAHVGQSMSQAGVR